MDIKIGDTVIHNGSEKMVTTITGDVLLLNDGMAVRNDDVSVVAKATQQETTNPPEMDIGARLVLRTEIEDLNPQSPIARVMEVVGDVDPSMRINTSVNWDLFKRDIIRRALQLGKIDPKVCEHCNQIIPE